MGRSTWANALCTTLVTVGNFYMGCFNELIIIFSFLTALDYFTGTVSALIRKKWSKEKAIQGAIEKFGFFIFIILGATLDYVLTFLGAKMTPYFSTKMAFCIVVTTWLIGIELQSNYRNLKEWGIKNSPTFLFNAFKKLSNTAEELSGTSNKKPTKSKKEDA